MSEYTDKYAGPSKNWGTREFNSVPGNVGSLTDSARNTVAASIPGPKPRVSPVDDSGQLPPVGNADANSGYGLAPGPCAPANSQAELSGSDCGGE